MSKASLIVLALLLVAIAAPAQDAAKDVEQTVDAAVGHLKNAQNLEDGWAQEQDALRARFRTARSDVAFLTTQRDFQQARVDALNERITEYDRRLTEAARLKESIRDTLGTIMGRLETWVGDDLPFLPDERSSRMTSLQDELARPDVTSAEKLRRVLESLLVEAGYGSSVEVTEERIEVAGEELYVDLLRIGRLSLFWMTPDAERIGEYDRGEAAWLELDGSYKRSITAAMEMATRMRPVELLALPLGRISR
jgi:hypothetical protein